MSYSDEQITNFIELAQEIGIGPAITELEYPKSRETARQWLKGRGVEITLDSLRQKAAELKHFYGYAEQMKVLQDQLTRLEEKLQDNDLTADDMKKLADALSKTINSMELIAGRATNRTATLDPENDELIRLVNSMKDRNEERKAEIQKDIQLADTF